MKLTKFGILGNKTTSLFTSIRDSKISRGCTKIWEIPEGRGGHTANPLRGGGGGMDIFWNHTFHILLLVHKLSVTATVTLKKTSLAKL